MSRILFLGLQHIPTGFYTIDIIREVEFLTNPVNKFKEQLNTTIYELNRGARLGVEQ
jgi:hypothetical protein